MGEIDNEKAPSVTGGALKISVRDISVRETFQNPPLKVESRIKDVHHTMVVRSKLRMTMLPKNAAGSSRAGNGLPRNDEVNIGRMDGRCL